MPAVIFSKVPHIWQGIEEPEEVDLINLILVLSSQYNDATRETHDLS